MSHFSDYALNSALFSALEKGRLAEISKLLMMGASPIEPNKDGVSPLLHGARSHQLEACKLLIDRGAVIGKDERAELALIDKLPRAMLFDPRDHGQSSFEIAIQRRDSLFVVTKHAIAPDKTATLISVSDPENIGRAIERFDESLAAKRELGFVGAGELPRTPEVLASDIEGIRAKIIGHRKTEPSRPNPRKPS